MSHVVCWTLVYTWTWMLVYSSIPGNRNWQIETADWNLDVRLDIWVKMNKETLCTPRNIAEKLAGWVKNRGFYFPGCYCIRKHIVYGMLVFTMLYVECWCIRRHAVCWMLVFTMLYVERWCIGEDECWCICNILHMECWCLRCCVLNVGV